MPREEVQPIGQVIARIDAKAALRLDGLAAELSDRIKASHRSGTPGGGRIYHRTNPPRTHRASAPFQPPAEDLGGLMTSIGWEAPTKMLRTVGPGSTSGSPRRPIPLGKWLEKGTKNMKKRPFIDPAVRRMKAAHK